MPRAELGDLPARPAECRTQILPTGTERTLQSLISEACHKMSIHVYVRLTLGGLRSSHGVPSFENATADTKERRMVAKKRGRQQVRDKREMVLMKLNVCF